MAINLFDLAYNLSPKKYAEIILSSGDYFPGFYRFTMGTRKYEPGQMTVSGLIKYYLNQQTTNQYRNRTEWFQKSIERMYSLDQRLKNRSDYSIYDLLNKKYKEWIETGEEYDIVLIETQNKKSLIADETYFFMGALIKFTEDSILLGYDNYRNEYVEKIPLDFKESFSIVNRIYGNNFSDLFLPSKLIGEITFQNEIGILNISDDLFNHILTVDSNSVVIASNRTKSKGLSMRWAKDICLTNYE
jgi:hypothetical protein